MIVDGAAHCDACGKPIEKYAVERGGRLICRPCQKVIEEVTAPPKPYHGFIIGCWAVLYVILAVLGVVSFFRGNWLLFLAAVCATAVVDIARRVARRY